MGRVEVIIEIDADLLARAQAVGVDFDAVCEAALRRSLTGEASAADQLWAEENALAFEALAGGAGEKAQ